MPDNQDPHRARARLGAYRECIDLLNECQKSLSSQGFKEGREEKLVEEIGILLQLSQAYQGMGNQKDCLETLRSVELKMEGQGLSFLKPYLFWLKGRYEILQGKLGNAFRFLREAATGFETLGEMTGKVEVLLSIYDALIEHFLMAEAKALIEEVASWEELNHFPALEHAVGLRRLALGAFSGNWSSADIKLIKQESQSRGRLEDWTKFWFHLSLASSRLGETSLARTFLEKAKQCGERIKDQLSDQEGKLFLTRPDMARIWRLSQGMGRVSGVQKIRAKRVEDSERQAPSGSFAPPRR